jgi:hypothetical protein
MGLVFTCLIMSEGNISQECQDGGHPQCTIQIPYIGGPQTTNCQCQCYPGTTQTFVCETKSVEDTKVLYYYSISANLIRNRS